MEQANYIKAIFTAVFAFLSALLGVLAVPVILLVACNLIDYATGLMASKYRAQDINSYKSIRGIFKKVSMWLLVVVGAIIDEMLLYASASIGWKSPVTFLVACVVAMWQYFREHSGHGSEYPGIYAAACKTHPIAGGRSGESR